VRGGSHDRCWYDYPERRWIQFLILRILYEKPMHGYRLMEEIEERSCGYHKLESGSIYTILGRMEERELIESAWEKWRAVLTEGSTRLQSLALKSFKEGLKRLSEGSLLSTV